MKPTQSTPRSPEAALLEADYALRLHEALRICPRSEAAEIEENVTGHIESAVAELDTEEVTLSQMAVILEELGPPEAMVTEPEDGFIHDDFGAGSAEFGPSAAEPPGLPKAGGAKVGEREFLDRLFVGYLIVTIGLWVPVIELYFCAIIGLAVIWRVLAKAPTAEIAGAKKWAAISLICAAAALPAALLTLADEILGLLSLPVLIGWLVSDVVLFWIVFGGLANWLEGKEMPELAEETRNRRIYYILTTFAIFLLAIPISLIIGPKRDVLMTGLVAYALLPLTWVINWFLILKPIQKIRKSL